MNHLKLSLYCTFGLVLVAKLYEDNVGQCRVWMTSLIHPCNEHHYKNISWLYPYNWNGMEQTFPVLHLYTFGGHTFCAGPHDGRRGPPTPGVHDFPWVFPERNIRNNFGGRYNVFDAMVPNDEYRTIRILNSTFNQTQRSQNFTLPIYMDDVPEGVEELNLTLSLQSGIPSTSVNVTPAVATVRIYDLSSKFIGQFNIVLLTRKHRNICQMAQPESNSCAGMRNSQSEVYMLVRMYI